MEHLLEVCVDSLTSAREAEAGGADRLELCANLIIGGTSPSPALIRQVLASAAIPVRVLLRPRFGDFCYDPAEKEAMLEEIAWCRELGVQGVVIGALTPSGELDAAFLEQCLQAAGPQLSCTLHRAFDLCRDPFEAMETAAALGFDAILTSGQQATALEGLPLLRQLVEQGDSRIHILAGSGVGPDQFPQLAAAGLRQFHFSAKHTVPSPMLFRRQGVPMGLPLADEYLRTSADRTLVAQAKAVLNAL